MSYAIIVYVFFTGGKCRPPEVALNNSPACVLCRSESGAAKSSPLLPSELLIPSLISLNTVLVFDDLDDVGEPLVELSLSACGDKPVRWSGFCNSN